MPKVDLPPETQGLRLCKVIHGRLAMCEGVRFPGGAPAVDTVLRRAAISGRVGPVGETGDYWADLLDANGDWFDTVALGRDAWNSLKNHWMRCKVESADGR
ncbi:hypothetical protein OL599_22730 [Rhodovastum sp. RN2-1]|uniref:Uncharacterized protein n=2 Tax=Limobrevibacterium gyesilva TaxID=2991712 RepID=A0AA41YNX4_9PROT|nr:hypothetical protein [Limobrevibacterium gyesilva]